MTSSDEMERDTWTRAGRMSKQEKLAEIRRMKAELMQAEKENEAQ
jgi:hypothetical protein